MLSSLAESFIQKFCGRYLKNFSSDNISISVTGVITLRDVQIKTEELLNFQFPYKLTKVYIGSLRADLPLVLGGNFDLSISDVLLVAVKNCEYDEDLEPSKVHKALQMWIGAYYLSFIHTEANRVGVSTGDIETSQKMFDKLVCTISNFHVRIEEVFTGHIPCPAGKEIVSLGLLIDKMELRPPTSAELAANDNVWSKTNSRTNIAVNKVFNWTGVSVYCNRDDPLGSRDDADISLAFVQNIHSNRKSDSLVEPFSIDINFSTNYQKINFVFGPSRVHLKVSPINIKVNDEQVVYISSMAQSIQNHVHQLQVRSRLLHCSFGNNDVKRRARMRWYAIRDLIIKKDMWKFASLQDKGSTRWRVWFDQWRMCARYVALREVLMFHVGFEAIRDVRSDSITYTLSESLYMDHKYDQFVKSRSEQNSELSEYINESSAKRYSGPGAIRPSILKAAEVLVYQQIQKTTKCVDNENNEDDNATIDPMSLSKFAVRALYALQLELDTSLPPKVSALCRMWAEERYRIRKSLFPNQNKSDANSNMLTNGTNLENNKKNSNSSLLSGVDMSAKSTSEQIPTAPAQSTSLFISVLDADKLMPTFGSSRVEAFCTLIPQNWDSVGFGLGSQGSSGDSSMPPINLASTDSNVVTVGDGSGLALVSWGDTFTYPLGDSNNPNYGNMLLANNNTNITVECNSRGLFAPSYGKIQLSVAELLKGHEKTISAIYGAAKNENDGKYESSIVESSFLLSRKKGLLIDGKDATEKVARSVEREENPMTLRILTMVVRGDTASHQVVMNKLRESADEKISAKKQVVSRNEQLQSQEQRGQDVEETFILDPSILTIQDCQVTMDVTHLSVLCDVLYYTPPQLRAQALAKGSELSAKGNIPTCHVLMQGLSMVGHFSSNPLVGVIRWELKRFTAWEYVTRDHSISMFGNHSQRRKKTTVVNFRDYSLSFDFTQISTMSKFISGTLDPSCFEWKATFKRFPFSVVISSKDVAHMMDDVTSLSTTTTTTSTGSIMKYSPALLWKSKTSLNHLYSKIEKWSKSSTICHFSDSVWRRRKPEANMILDNNYELYPKFMNCLNEVRGHIQHVFVGQNNSNNSNSSKDIDYLGSNMPTQSSCVSFLTRSNRLTLSIDVNAVIDDIDPMKSKSALIEGSDSEDSDDSDDDDMKDYEDFEDTEYSTSNVSTVKVPETKPSDGGLNIMEPVAGFLDWVTFSTKKDEPPPPQPPQPPQQSSSSNAKNNSNTTTALKKHGRHNTSDSNLSSAASSQISRRSHHKHNSHHSSSSTTSQWLMEKTRLEAKIRELESRNNYLENLLEAKNNQSK